MKSTVFAALQYALPKQAMTRLVWRLARVRTKSVKDTLIRQFIRAFDVDISDAKLSVPDDFATFNDFFIRELEDGARPIAEGEDVLVSPVDGTVSQLGPVRHNLLVQAKGLDYSIEELLAVDVDKARDYEDGSFACIYLAPYNYHRVHSPISGQLVALHCVPGDLFSVNAMTAEKVPRLFARNERLNFHFETANGPFMLSMVGALNVGSMTTPWTGEIRPRAAGIVENLPLPEVSVAKGDLLGWFNMGSTVVMLSRSLDWNDDLASGSVVRMGEAIARHA